MRCLIVLIVGFFFFACGEPASQEAKNRISTPQKTNTRTDSQNAEPYPRVENRASKTLLTVFQNDDGSWGYEIAVNGRRMIYQPHKPAVGGKSGFEKKTQAEAVGAFVQHKIEAGIMPPSVTAAEVDSLENVYK